MKIGHIKLILFLILLLGQNTHAQDSSNEINETDESPVEEMCIPPEFVDAKLSQFKVEDKKEDLTKQPELGCAVILCLANPKGWEAVSECRPPVEELLSTRWLANYKPKWPSCSDNGTKSTGGIVRTYKDIGQCRLTTKKVSFNVIDSRLGEGFINDVFNGFLSVPMDYTLSHKPPRKDNSCPYLGDTETLTWKPKRETEETDDEPKTVRDLFPDAPVCEVEPEEKTCVTPEEKAELDKQKRLMPRSSQLISDNTKKEELPVCKASCIAPANKEALLENSKLPKEEQLPKCGECDVTPKFLESIGAEKLLFASEQMKPFKNTYKWKLTNFTMDLNKTMNKYGIKSCYQKAHFISQTMHETLSYQKLRESDNKANTYLTSKRYWPYYGRGLIHLTGKWNYMQFDSSTVISNLELGYLDRKKTQINKQMSY